ncbi:MAG: glycosyltransferase family 2 protein [Proteobacteria bacterium]|nr:glycosyltransferase family 2 protein [Pseudomonadota bacterium]
MDKRYVVFIIPALNESAVIGETVQGAYTIADEVVVVNDGSTDNTSRVAKNAGATVLTHRVNLGQGAALQTGIEFACQIGATHIVTFDADGQHAPSDVEHMIDRIDRENLDVVLGTRGWKRHGMPFGRFVLLRCALVYTRLTTGLKLTDTHNGLRVFTTRAASQLNLAQNRMAHASEILDRIASCKMKYSEEPVKIVYTEYSQSKGQSNFLAFRILFDLTCAKLGLADDHEHTHATRQQAVADALEIRSADK